MFKSIAHCLGILSLFTATIASAETVTVRSGNGTVGGNDTSVHFLLGPTTGGFGRQFTFADFSSTQTGPAAFIVAPSSNWITRLSADASAQWIGTNTNASCCQGNTAMYAISIPIAKSFVSATLTLSTAVDNSIGETQNPGVYLNGIAVCGNAFANSPTQERVATCNNIGPILHPGTNWLYIEAINAANSAGLNPAGLLFSATITTTEGTTLPHVAAGDVWTTNVFVINTGSQPAEFTLQFFDNSGNSLPLPFAGGPTSTLVDSVPAQGLNFYEAAAPGSPLLVGWGLFTADSSVSAHAVFRKHTPDGLLDEAAIASSSGTLEFIIPFDASTVTGTNVPLFTAIAIANLDPTNSANVVCVARNQLGATIFNAVSVPPLNPLGHWSEFNFPALTGLRGTIDCTASTAVSAVAFRFFGTTFSSLPVLNINPTAPIPPTLPNPQPSITSLSPSSATAGTPSLALIVNGGGFIASSTATFNGLSRPVALVNSGQLTISLNAGDLATAGMFPVAVTNPSPGGGVSNSVMLTVVPPVPNGLTGVWAGSWSSVPVPGAFGLMSGVFTQNGTTLTGTVGFSSSVCFTGGSLSGTVSGNSFSAVIATSGIAISGTVDSTGSSITGTYIVSSGTCAGDFGNITLKRQ